MIGQKLKTAPPTGGHVFQRIGTTFELNQDIIKANILTNFKLGRDFIGTKLLTKFHEDGTRNQMLTDGRTGIDGQRPVTKAHLSNQPMTHIEKTFPPPGGHVFSQIMTIFELIQDIYKIDANNVTSRKSSPSPGGHTILELIRHINETNVLTKFHDDWAKIVTSRVFTRNTAPPPGGHLHKDWASNVPLFFLPSIVGTNVLTKFHEDRTIKCGL
ncbi:hypothetical protein DPMN_156728 [Dreissena polymorpha]|uniref:Uncharacterized protein n=1 Tax=Dreissena polymorpha TaxID=45954 RepID=A0A9D4J916_DREPO|nr:hypothetical protein DPMN_156728 [Dreissena polymorpha]